MAYENFKIPTAKTTPRMYPAWKAMEALLADWGPHDRREVEADMLRASDLSWKTVENLVYAALGIGFLVKVGKHQVKRSVSW